MRHIATGLAILVALLALVAALRGVIARALDARWNGLARGAPAGAVSGAAERLHRRLWIADLHCDATFWDRDLCVRATRGHVDLPRLREGRVALQVLSFPNAYPLFANYRRTPARPDVAGLAAVAHDWPRSTWASPPRRALFQAGVVAQAVLDSEGGLALVTGARGLASWTASGDSTEAPVLAVLAVEGLHLAAGDLAAVDQLFAAGVRVFGLAHMSDNAVAGSAHGWRKHGLSDFGRRVVARIDSLGGIVDLAHASEATIDDVLAHGTVPVLVSHTGVDGTCPGERNLSDAQLSALAARGAVIGVGFWKGATCGDDAESIARAMAHAARVAGIEAVALGSDFDGAVRTPFDAAGVAKLTDALLAQGFDAHAVARIMGLNVLEFFLRALPPE